MRRNAAVVAVLVSCLVVARGKDPRTVRITEANKDKFVDEIKDMRGLTVDEGRLLFAYLLRHNLSQGLGQTPPSLVGKTVGDLITEQKTFEADAKQQEAEQARLAAEAKAKEEAVAAELRKAINLTVSKKGFLESDPMSRRYDDYITVKCAYENKSAKDIRAFTGDVRFTDLFDKPVFASGLTISDPIKAGAKADWSDTIEYNQFKDEHRAFRNAELKDLKVVWVPQSIIFADGTKAGEQE
jgi:hypothetical protein